MKIAVLSGDGIGPEVMVEALKVLDVVGGFEFVQAAIGGAAYDLHGDHFPDETRKICEESDAILFGSVGGPIEEQMSEKWNNCEKNSILGLRKHFGLTINLRPVKVYDCLKDSCVLCADIVEQGIDMLCVRELSAGIYFGEHYTEGDKAFDVMEYDRVTIEGLMRVAFEAAMKRRKKVTSVDKANVLDCSKLWRKVAEDVSRDYSECELEHILIDNCAMQVLKRPCDFDVIALPNMFGDIISDEVSVFAGSLGMLPSASLNAKGFGMYEPSGGSAPDIAGKGVANPIAQILSAAMMLKHSFDMHKEHDQIVNAVQEALESGVRTSDLTKTASVSTSEMGDQICKFLTKEQ